MPEDNLPRLFGLQHSNRDFSLRDSWGKNQFNSSFPAALCCYLHFKGYGTNYLSMIDGSFGHAEIAVPAVFRIHPTDNDIYFAFESIHTPFQQYIIGTLPRTDLVIQKRSTGQCLVSLEVKLTALPDHATSQLSNENFGSEIVVRPDTIVYLACSIAKSMGDNLNNLLPSDIQINDWSETREVLPYIEDIIDSLKNISVQLEHYQSPFLLQPIWKTVGKLPQLATNCLDVFFWSNAGFIHFITEIAESNAGTNRITRQIRTSIWLFKMLLDIKDNGQYNHRLIIDTLSYNTKNDKAFASSGNITNRFMSSPRLGTPIIRKDEIKNIILGGGQNLLSPERRLDAIIFHSPELFN